MKSTINPMEVIDTTTALAIMVVIALATILVLLILSRQDNGYRFVDNLMSLGRDGVMRANNRDFVFIGGFYFTSLWGTWLAWSHELTDTYIFVYIGTWSAVTVASNAIKAYQASVSGPSQDLPNGDGNGTTTP